MPITQYNQVTPGLLVSIILKADQRTGKQTQGTVAQLLSRHDHPRGIKVRLTDGRVGRVEKISRDSRKMNSDNPWGNQRSEGNPYSSNNPYNQQQQPQQPQQALNQSYYNNSQQNHQQPANYSQPQQGGYTAPQGHPPSQGIRRSDTEQIRIQEGDIGAQFETMQQYESNITQNEDDRNQAELQKLFPNIDSSLIAAIYNERKPNMGEVRELLQELDTN